MQHAHHRAEGHHPVHHRQRQQDDGQVPLRVTLQVPALALLHVQGRVQAADLAALLEKCFARSRRNAVQIALEVLK